MELFWVWDALSLFLTRTWAPIPVFYLMLRVPLVMELSFGVIGLLAHGRHLRALCPLPTKSLLRWLWLLTCGAPPGLLGEWSFYAIMKLWCPF